VPDASRPFFERWAGEAGNICAYGVVPRVATGATQILLIVVEVLPYRLFGIRQRRHFNRVAVAILCGSRARGEHRPDSKADHTRTEIELTEATEVVQNAELFVQTVERVFSLGESSLEKEYENPTSKGDDKVSEPVVAASEIERKGVKLEPISLKEIRRQARENWLQLRQQKVGVAKGVGHS
jgi:hypothetical protein